MQVRKSQAGMTLIEVMVAVSIITVMILAMMTMGKNMDKTAKNAEKRGDIESIMQQINQALTNKDTCSATVMGAATGVNSTTMLTGIKSFGANGLLSNIPTLSVSSITAGDIRNQVVINGMYLTNRLDHGTGASYDLVVTFVKNPKAAGGSVASAQNVLGNYITRKIPLQLDNCTRSLRWAVAPSLPTCGGGTVSQVGPPIAVNSANASSPDTTFNVIACRDCASRTTVRGCN